MVLDLLPFGWVLAAVFLVWLGASWALNRVGARRVVPSRVEVLFGDRLRRRLPGFATGRSTVGLFYPEAAVLDADRCREWLQGEAAGHGCRMLEHTSVESLQLVSPPGEPAGVRVTLERDGGEEEVDARQVVVAAGGWSGEVLGALRSEEGEPVPAAVGIGRAGITFSYPEFALRAAQRQDWDARGADPMPIFTYPVDGYFGFPPSDDRPTLVVKSMHGGRRALPREMNHNPAAAAETVEWVRRALPGVLPAAVPTANVPAHCCHYASLVLGGRERQVIDVVPGTDGRVVLAAGFDAWGFKYGSIVGDEIAEVLRTGVPPGAGLEWDPSEGEGRVMGTLHRAIHRLTGGTIVRPE